MSFEESEDGVGVATNESKRLILDSTFGVLPASCFSGVEAGASLSLFASVGADGVGVEAGASLSLFASVGADGVGVEAGASLSLFASVGADGVGVEAGASLSLFASVGA
ncbi:hypothetical protein, partial [Apilactobacillus micheneri]|uniref:hypothetical protein n=1 Tax=Apilactobacillus micheneri TaxID=1899430 RepID=UPI003340B365